MVGDALGKALVFVGERPAVLTVIQEKRAKRLAVSPCNGHTEKGLGLEAVQSPTVIEWVATQVVAQVRLTALYDPAADRAVQRKVNGRAMPLPIVGDVANLRAVALAAFLLVFQAGWSYVHALTAPGTDPLSARSVEWVRDHGGIFVVRSSVAVSPL